MDKTPTPKDIQVRAGDKLGRDIAAFNAAKREYPSATERMIEANPEGTARLLAAIFSPERADAIAEVPDKELQQLHPDARVEVATPKREFVLQPELTHRPFVTPELMELKRTLRRNK